MVLLAHSYLLGTDESHGFQDADARGPRFVVAVALRADAVSSAGEQLARAAGPYGLPVHWKDVASRDLAAGIREGSRPPSLPFAAFEQRMRERFARGEGDAVLGALAELHVDVASFRAAPERPPSLSRQALAGVVPEVRSRLSKTLRAVLFEAAGPAPLVVLAMEHGLRAEGRWPRVQRAAITQAIVALAASVAPGLTLHIDARPSERDGGADPPVHTGAFVKLASAACGCSIDVPPRPMWAPMTEGAIASQIADMIAGLLRPADNLATSTPRDTTRKGLSNKLRERLGLPMGEPPSSFLPVGTGWTTRVLHRALGDIARRRPDGLATSRKELGVVHARRYKQAHPAPGDPGHPLGSTPVAAVEGTLAIVESLFARGAAPSGAQGSPDHGAITDSGSAALPSAAGGASSRSLSPMSTEPEPPARMPELRLDAAALAADKTGAVVHGALREALRDGKWPFVWLTAAGRLLRSVWDLRAARQSLWNALRTGVELRSLDVLDVAVDGVLTEIALAFDALGTPADDGVAWLILAMRDDLESAARGLAELDKATRSARTAAVDEAIRASLAWLSNELTPLDARLAQRGRALLASFGRAPTHEERRWLSATEADEPAAFRRILSEVTAVHGVTAKGRRLVWSDPCLGRARSSSGVPIGWEAALEGERLVVLPPDDPPLAAVWIEDCGRTIALERIESAALLSQPGAERWPLPPRPAHVFLDERLEGAAGGAWSATVPAEVAHWVARRPPRS